ncbi:hypothetical protein Nepgr_016865 [Nepenthes gracilis]|uniref:Uncharacterized protein n=1 Tax=Nepenthes gracilis TaxID=150966 RepID=A0AAD3SQG4_NEPGR|nr:hypothetical protein Nepgr_016865 [Nepenthes gracilis]
MPSSYFPLRWESTGDKWWYAAPIDWAAANGLYDLVRQLIRLDGNHLIKLTSLRRIRRLEAVWDDDEEQFHGVANCRCEVARRLFEECESKKGAKNSLIGAGYGGWLLYTAAAAGDLGFVQLLLERDPLLVFGEGEYGVTDMLYAAARSKDPRVFWVIYDFAASPRFWSGDGREMTEQIGEIPSAFKREVMNRAVHAAARGGNLMVLKQLLGDCEVDALGYRDVHGSTILHAAAGRGQVEVVNYLLSSCDIISSTDNDGNTALHVAAFRGQLSVVEALVVASPSSISVRNKAGNTFLHMAVAGFQTPGFRRLDRQIELMKQVISRKVFNIEDIVNAKNCQGRTALHMAIIGNVHCSLVGLLMTARYINMNICDDQGLTPLDYLRQQPRSSSSETLIRQMISAGGIYSCQDYTMRKAFASHLAVQGTCTSPGSSFKVSDTEIFLHTGIGHASISGIDRQFKANHSSSSSEVSHCDSTTGDNGSVPNKKLGSVNIAAKRLKTMFQWPMKRKQQSPRPKKDGHSQESTEKCHFEETPIPLRQRFSKPTSLSNNKRTLAVRSNISSPTNRKKFASGVVHGVLQDLPHIKTSTVSSSSSFSKSLIFSPQSLDKGKGVVSEDDIVGPSCSNKIDNDDRDTPSVIRQQDSSNKRLMKRYLCFGGPRLSVRNSFGRQQVNHSRQSSQPVNAVD